MPPQFTIPRSSRFWQVSASFQAEFNAVNGVPTGSGQYDFGQTVNESVLLMPVATRKNTVYWFDVWNVGGDIGETDYLDAIATVPTARLERKFSRESIYSRPLPVVNYVDNQIITAWFKDEKGNDEIRMTFLGLLNQTANLVGVQFINIFVSMNIYAIDARYWVEHYLEDLLPSAGAELRRA